LGEPENLREALLRAGERPAKDGRAGQHARDGAVSEMQ